MFIDFIVTARLGPDAMTLSSIALRITSSLCLAMGGAGMVWAEAPGIPINPLPQSMVPFYLDWWNDAAGWPGENPDDHRSQQLTVGGSLGLGGWDLPQWRLVGALDHSILTERGPQRDATDAGVEGRLDMMTVSAGLLREWQHQRGHIGLGGGLSYRGLGNFDGEHIQNNWHQVVEVPAVDLPETGTQADEIGFWLTASATTSWSLQQAGPFKRFGFWSNAVAHSVSDGQSEQSLRLATFVDGPWLALWMGIRVEGRQGYDHDLVMRSVAEWEDGISIMGGARILPWLVFETGMNIESDGRYGRIGIVTGDSLGDMAPESAHLWGGHIGMLGPDFNLTTGLRYRRRNWTWGNWAPSLAITFRNGQSSVPDPDGAVATATQISAGIDLEHQGAFLGIHEQVHFFSTLSLGHRREQVRDQISDEVISGSPAHAGVLVIDAGVRLGSFSDRQARALLTLGGSAWVPLRSSRHISIHGKRVEQQAPHAALMLSIDLAVQF